LLVILLCQSSWRAEDQPGRPARGERASWRLRHRGQWLRAAPLPGGQPLGLAHASDIERHNPILTLKALATDGPEEMGAIATPAVPPGEEGGFVGIQNTAVAAMPRLALRKRRALEVPLHGAPTEPDLVRDGVQRPALPMGGPDLVIVGPPVG